MATTAPLRVEVVKPTDPLVQRTESERDIAGFAIPLPSRAAWGRLFGGALHEQALVFERGNRCVATLGFSIAKTRALPGHRVLRLEAMGDGYASQAGHALIERARQRALEDSRILRVVVELECRSATARESLRRSLSSAGFYQGPAERVASRTLELDLSGDEAALFSGLSRSTRQNIRSADRFAVSVRSIDDPTLAPRMNMLLGEAFARTGAHVTDVDWKAVVKLDSELPHRSRLSGAFRQASEGPP